MLHLSMTDGAAQSTSRLELPLKTLAAAVGLGLIGDQLLLPAPWGIGVPIYVALVIAACGWLARGHSERFDRTMLGVAAAALLFAASFAAAGRGVLIAAPLLLIFGGLFASADASFERLLSNAFRFDVDVFVQHLVIFVACLVLVGGLLRRLILSVEPPPKVGPPPPPMDKVGITEVGIVLGSLNLLFAAFVATQFGRLFGGAELVRATNDLSVAEYARRGFFELATVSFLTLAVLVGSHAVLKKEGRAEGTFRFLAAGLVVLVFVVMQSAVNRMRLYVDSFGITELRLYVLAAIGWIAAVFLWFVWTTLRGRHDRFAFGGLVLFLVGVLTLNAVNPDAVIARTNTRRPGLDAQYLTTLSADAVPELIRALPSLPMEFRQPLRDGLAAKRKRLEAEDPRTWNSSRRQAAALLADL